MTAKEHNKLLSTLLFVLGCLQCVGLVFMLLYIVMGLLFMVVAPGGPQKMMGGIFFVVGLMGAVFIFLFAGLNILTSRKLSRELPEARTWGIIASVLLLLGFPLGTALGVYGLWFLMGDMGKQFYSGNTFADHAPPPAVPPGPQSWQ